MYTQTNIVSKVTKLVAKPTAFFAAFLLLVQPFAVVFAESDLQTEVAVSTAQSASTSNIQPSLSADTNTKQEKAQTLLDRGATKEEVIERIDHKKDIGKSNVGNTYG